MTEKSTQDSINSVLRVIKEERKSKGLSHENMAYELGLSPSAYNKIERNETQLTLKRLFEIRQVLEIPLSKLFKFEAENVFNQEIQQNATGYQKIENLYQDNKTACDAHIKSLKEEIAFLKEIVQKIRR